MRGKIPFGIQLYSLAMFEVEFVELQLKKLNLDKHQFLYLIIVSIFPGIVQSQIAEYFNVNKSTSGRMIKKLVDRRWLKSERQINNRDNNIYLTPEGEKQKENIINSIKEYENIILKTVDKKKDFLRIFDNIFENTATARKDKEMKGAELWRGILTNL